MGMLFVLAYPRYFVWLTVLIVIVAFGLEALQHLTPDRHGHLLDATEKVAGGLVGCMAAKFLQIVLGKYLADC
jgi:hypothetical protein